MKIPLLFLLALSTASTLLGQTDSVISRNATNAVNSSINFTNSAGGTFSMAELENHFADLNRVISQTLPVLAAFNTNFSAPGAGESLGGVLSKVLSKDRGENKESDTGETTGGSTGSKVTSNLVGILRGILTTNNTAGVVGANVNANTAAQLQTLQQHLEASRSILDTLNLGTNSTRVLTPTGR